MKRIINIVFGFMFVLAMVLSPSIIAVSDASLSVGTDQPQQVDSLADHVLLVSREAVSQTR